MKNVFYTIIVTLVVTLPCAVHAQSDFVIYSAEKKVDSETKYDIFDQTGKRIFNNPVDWAYSTRWNWIVVKNKTTKYCDIFYSNGQPLGIKDVQEIRDPLKNVNRVGIKINGKWGFYDKAGQLKINHTYDNISSFYNDMAAAEVDGKIAMIDTNGIQINIPYDPKESRYFMGESFDLLTLNQFYNSDNYKLIVENDKKGIADKDAKVVVPAKYDEFVDFLEKQRLVTVIKDGLYGVVNFEGNEVIPIKYSKIYIVSK